MPLRHMCDMHRKENDGQEPFLATCSPLPSSRVANIEVHGDKSSDLHIQHW